MKKIVFGLIATVMLSFSGFAINSTTKNVFPKYSENLSSAFACSCSGAFSSCSGSGNCSCTCGYFTCSCTANEKPAPSTAQIDISISKTQYQNIEKLVLTLEKLNEITAISYLAKSIENLKEEDAQNFEENRIKFFNQLSLMSESNKEKLNTFFVEIGANERV